MEAPFIIYALPRSRTAWLSIFLTYKDWVCGHDLTMYMRSMDDVRGVFSRPNTGTSETAAIPGRALIRHAVPNIKEVVVLRPVDDVIESVKKIDISSVGAWDLEKVKRILAYEDRLLRKTAQEPGVLAINFADLAKKETCQLLFEHVFPYKFDVSWWESLKDENIQIDTVEQLRYRFAHRSLIDDFKRRCKLELIKLCRMGEVPLARMV